MHKTSQAKERKTKMPRVLEILRLASPDKSPLSNDPKILAALRAVRHNLKESVHNTDSRFYVRRDRPENIYVFGEWDSVAQHVNFMRSAAREEILKPQEGMLEFVGVVHVQMTEGGIESLLDGKREFRLEWGASREEGKGRSGGGVVEMRRCDEGFEEEVYIFNFSGNGSMDDDQHKALSGNVELVDIEMV